MSAEKRLAALREWLLHPDRSYSPHALAMEAVRRIDEGVSVPTEPGAPDPEPDSTLTFVARGNPPRPVLVGISPHPAKAPVPAPEPSARLREALVDALTSAHRTALSEAEAQYEALGTGSRIEEFHRGRVSAYSHAIEEVHRLAATPQDPEA